MSTGAAAVMSVAVAGLCGCGSGAGSTDTGAIPPALLREARPIGSGGRFHPPARGPVIGACRPTLGARNGVHVELFAANRVVVLAAGIGLRGPVKRTAGRIVHAGCYSALVTVEPTGVVLVRPGARVQLGDLFRAWGEPLSGRRAASFRAPGRDPVRVYVGGRLRAGIPGDVALVPHGEIVVEVGPPVLPHRTYTFPPGT